MSLQTLDLNGPWEFKEYPESARRMRDLEEGQWLPAEVPSSIFTCLIRAGQITSPDLHENPSSYAWISEKSWVFRKVFDLPQDLAAADRIDLVCRGLDTVAHIWLNEKLVAKTDNMFLGWRFDITRHLKPKSNTLLIRFSPALQTAAQRMARYGALSDRIWGDRRRVYLRKAQYQFGSPYNPAYPGCGIWRPIFLQAAAEARIDNLHIRTIECSQHYADLRIAVSLDTTSADLSANLRCDLHFTGGGLNLKKTISFDPSRPIHSDVIRIERPILWWPNGYGLPHLYTLTATLKKDGRCLDEKKVPFGIRTIHLRQEADAHGPAFEWIVNEQPIRIQGMHWMPLSPFPAQTEEQKYRDLLTRFQKIRGNMLRVWAGGYYEQDEFYDLCDRLGILIWQDFPFAEAYYPDRNWFLETVQAETRQIICHLRNHPCLALWCGNDRCDHLHTAGRLGDGRKFYGKAIYRKILPDLLSELDPDRDYIPTSCGDCPAGPGPWDILSDTKPTSRNNVPRFCSDFECPSLPSGETIPNGPKPLQNIPGSRQIPFLLQKCAEFFNPPRDLDELIAQSQVVQARLAGWFVQQMRIRPDMYSGWLMKSWNECGPALSPSSIDSAGNPKAVYYYAKRFMNSLLVALLQDPARSDPDHTDSSTALQAVVLNDRPAPLTAALQVRMMNLEGTVLDQTRFPLSLGPFKVSSPLSLPRDLNRPQNPADSFLYLTLQDDHGVLAENTFFFLPDKWINWSAPEIDCQIEPQPPHQWILTLTSRRLVRDLWIRPPAPAELSDNFFDLLPGQSRTISIGFKNPAPPVRLPLRLTCLSVSGSSCF
jgi:beta-mannosidase